MPLSSRLSSARTTPIILAGLLAAAACESTSPADRLGGVWGARAVFAADADSLTLALGQQGSEVRGFGVLRRADEPTRYLAVLSVRGSIVGRSVELYLTTVGFPGHTTVLRGEFGLGTVTGSLPLGESQTPIFLRRSDRDFRGVEGTWVLTSRTGEPSGDPGVVRDTIVVFRDGRARRFRGEQFWSYSSLAIWSRRAGWLVLEQAAGGAFPVPFFDSLRVERGALVRITPAGGDATIVETFVRVSRAGSQ